MQEYYLLALAEPRRDKVLREGSKIPKDTSRLQAASSLAGPPHLQVSSVVRPLLSGQGQGPSQKRPNSTAEPYAFHLSADSTSSHADQGAVQVAAAATTAADDPGMPTASSWSPAESLVSETDRHSQTASYQDAHTTALTSGQQAGAADLHDLDPPDEQVRLHACVAWTCSAMMHAQGLLYILL